MRNAARFWPWGLALLIAALLLVAMLGTSGGRFAFPLDDSYIYLHYASQNAHGQLFRYNDGDPATSGATSLLYALVLTPAAVLLKGTSLAIFAFALAVVFVALSLRLVHRLATRWLGSGLAWPAVALTTLSGPFLWGAFSGMETALVAWLALASLDAFDRAGAEAPTKHATRDLALYASLFAAARPECGALVIGLFILSILVRRGPSPFGWRALVVPAAFAFAPFLVNLVLTGSPSSTTLASKGSPFLPGTSVGTWMIEATQFFLHNLKALFDSGDAAAPTWPSAYTTLTTFAAPFTLFFAVLGLAPALAGEIARRRPGVALAAGSWLAGMLVLWAALVPINLHWSRYATPYLPLVALLATGGIQRLSSFARDDEGRALLRRGLLGFQIAVSVPVFLFFVAVYGWNCHEIRSQHIAMASWLRERASPGSWIATNDVGALAYYGGHPVLDLHGLTSRDLARCKQAGSGAIYEHLERLPAARRPGLLVVIPGWFEPNFLRMHRPVRSQTLRKAMIAGSPLVAYQASWEAAGSGDAPGPEALAAIGGFSLADRLDVADLASEDAHRYALRLLPGEAAGPIGILTAPGAPSPSIDGGRLVTGGETFEMKLAPGRDAVLVMRAMGNVRALLRVDGGAPIRVGGVATSEDSWTEVAVPVPGSVIRRSPAHLTLEALDGALEEGGYTSFHYWVFQ